MKNCYVSTFISGLSEIVNNLIVKELLDVEIIQTFDGMIIYKTANHDKISKLKFVNNTFLLLGLKRNKVDKSFNDDMWELVQKLNLNFTIIKNHIKSLKKRNFKILTVDKNQPVSINYKLIEKLEKTIENNLKVNLNKRNPDLEFTFLRRSEGIMLFMLKLTYNRMTEKQLQKGELRPELAYSLVSLANLNEDKIIMDPFCGHGSIPKQIVKNFKYNMCFASDNDETMIQKLKNEYKKNTKKLFIKKRDALHLDYFEDKFIDAIVTDPPWNIYESTNEQFDVFYKNMLEEFYRILKDNGTLIILMGNVNDFEIALDTLKKFKITKEYNILVNGKKANIYVLKKINRS